MCRAGCRLQQARSNRRSKTSRTSIDRKKASTAPAVSPSLQQSLVRFDVFCWMVGLSMHRDACHERIVNAGGGRNPVRATHAVWFACVCTGSFRLCELRWVALARVLRRSLTLGCSELEQRFVRIFSVTVRCPAEDARRLFVCLFVTEFASYWPLSGREARNGGRGEAGGRRILYGCISGPHLSVHMPRLWSV
jgi:hypothetical protein